MLSRQHRLSSSSDFTRTLRRGVRVRRADMVVHVVSGTPIDPESIGPRDPVDVCRPRFGLIVSKAVGDSVTRHAVARRLRAGARSCVDEARCADSTQFVDTVVIRALPSAAGKSSTVLGHQLRAALRAARAGVR